MENLYNKITKNLFTFTWQSLNRRTGNNPKIVTASTRVLKYLIFKHFFIF